MLKKKKLYMLNGFTLKVKNLKNFIIQAVLIIGRGLATTGLLSAGAGIGVVFVALKTFFFLSYYLP